MFGFLDQPAEISGLLNPTLRTCWVNGAVQALASCPNFCSWITDQVGHAADTNASRSEHKEPTFPLLQALNNVINREYWCHYYSVHS